MNTQSDSSRKPKSPRPQSSIPLWLKVVLVLAMTVVAWCMVLFVAHN